MSKKVLQLTVRFTPQDMKQLRQAASLEEEPVAGFIRDAAVRAARERITAWAQQVILDGPVAPASAR